MDKKPIRYVTTEEIKSEINERFTTIYKNCTKKYEDNEAVAQICNNIISDPSYLNFIILSNDISKIPPTKTFLRILKHDEVVNSNFEFTPHDSQYIGSLMGFIFKHIFNYKNQKDRVRVEILGVSTASRFKDCPDNTIVIDSNPS